MLKFSEVIDGTTYNIEQQASFTRQFEISTENFQHQIVKDDFDEWHMVDSKELHMPLPVNELGKLIDARVAQEDTEL